MTLFKNIYRVESTRMPEWNYSHPGRYFITLCAHNHACWFGDIRNDEMVLSLAGQIVNEEWAKTQDLRPYIRLDAWCVMPNHVHGIVVITSHRLENSTLPKRARRLPDVPSYSLGSIIGQFKMVCTKRIRASGLVRFRWQSRYFDHLIRNDQAMEMIRHYIKANSARWNEDRYHPGQVKRFPLGVIHPDDELLL